MAALSSQAALLDELFGIDRNSTTKREIKWDDESLCKYYLAGFCPHDLFVNTKISLGQCPKVHDTKLLEKYKNSSQFLKMGYEKKLQQFLQRYVDDVKKKIVYNLDRLENGLLSGTEVSIQKRITMYEKDINELVEKIEIHGNEGRIEECRNLNSELEEKQKTLKYDRIELETQRRNTRERLEEVCNICGAYISKNDPRNSLENHVSGRIHCSYVKINEVLNELNETLKKADRVEERRNSPDKDSRSNSRYREHSRYTDRDYGKERDRNHESSRDKHRGSTNSRDYDRNERNHDKERYQEKSRDMSRTKKYEYAKRSRDRSSEDYQNQNLKDRKRSRSRSFERRTFNCKDNSEKSNGGSKEKSWGEI